MAVTSFIRKLVNGTMLLQGKVPSGTGGTIEKTNLRSSNYGIPESTFVHTAHSGLSTGYS